MNCNMNVRTVQQLYGRIAQLVRAPRLHRGGQGFESLFAHTRDYNVGLAACGQPFCVPLIYLPPDLFGNVFQKNDSSACHLA